MTREERAAILLKGDPEAIAAAVRADAAAIAEAALRVDDDVAQASAEMAREGDERIREMANVPLDIVPDVPLDLGEFEEERPPTRRRSSHDVREELDAALVRYLVTPGASDQTPIGEALTTLCDAARDGRTRTPPHRLKRARARGGHDDVAQGVRERLEVLAMLAPGTKCWGRRANTIAKALATIERAHSGAVSGVESAQRKILFRFRDEVLVHLATPDAFAPENGETVPLLRALVKLVRIAPWLLPAPTATG